MRNNNRRKHRDLSILRKNIDVARGVPLSRAWKLRLSVMGAVLLGIASPLGFAENMTMVSAADTGQSPVSRGQIRCEEAVMDAADLQSIYAYVSEKKNAAADTLLQLGTKFREQSGEIICDRNPDSDRENIDTSRLSWPMIEEAVKDSQTVPDGLTVLNPEAAMHIEGVEEYTDHYVTAAEDNISRGKAAWANGRLLLGNGADNDRAYQKGTDDGGNGKLPEFLNPLFSVQDAGAEIRHAHVGNPEETEGISGCYQNSRETKKNVIVCGTELKKTEATWYPNPDEPEGGSWHGGYYTCPYHGGMYESPGRCTYEDVVVTTVWHHDVICGLTDMVYARLAVHGTDSDPVDRSIKLEADLEEGEGYERLVWQGEDKLVWTGEDGTVLNTGSELVVQAPGTYRCSANVTNEDIDNREVSVMVKVSGFMLRN